jgi:zinc D-Ala-D-Ala dipeptidase
VLCSCGEKDAVRASRLRKKNLNPYCDSLAKLVRQKINPDTSYLESVFNQYGLVNIHSLDNTIRVDLRYASTNNFTGKNLYDGLRNAYFPCDVANRLCNAQYFLKKYDSTLSLCILDAARPLHIQQMMWDSLDLPANIKFNYLSAPSSISLHNYGCAVDLTIVDLRLGKELDMGTAFDQFDKLSEPIYEAAFLAKKELSGTAFHNRKLLRSVMGRAGFNPINSEWWHFNYCNKEQAAAKFALIK